MPSNHLILCRPLLLPRSIFPSIGVFSDESGLCIRWPKDWSFSFNISPSNEHPGMISFRMVWLDLLAVQGTLKSSPTSQLESISSSVFSLTYGPTLTSIHDSWKNCSFDYDGSRKWELLCPFHHVRTQGSQPSAVTTSDGAPFPWFLYGNNSQRRWSSDTYCRPSCIHPDFQASFYTWLHPWCYDFKHVLHSHCIWVWDPENCAYYVSISMLCQVSSVVSDSLRPHGL